ncbi:FecCD family ABC transporter permease [Cellulosilyticum lentocellum]|uniref:ABC-type transporter, integral membrane subunit n=1 Tax=Cellulosilyticum lentocellum (strain ATCC 49066 / DSM 5427 / NCIMB 11756 / RHM5) TaxID=642492 RepID=F2JPX0_CELLD|nr:iron ABC transporter permease [Cellulosilyticum lentocellum]ADZ84905.1 ABC-type transporter, integral membrane subunit [Cellulosilyticum lentocellum DSM 5427]
MKKRILIASIMTSLLLLVAILIAMSWGSYTISFPNILQTLIGNGNKLQSMTIWDIRLPRIFVALVVALCLSTSGCVLQGVTRNELAEPGIIGINAGAGLAVVLLINYGGTNYYSQIGDLSLFLMPFVAIIGALLSAMIIYRLSYKRGISPTRLILVGIGVNAGINAIITLYQLNMSKGDYNQVLTWISGSLWGSSWKFFYVIAPLAIIFLGLVFWKAKTLDVLDLGDEIATGLGVKVEKERRILMFYGVALAAIATAVAGNITFLGLLGPHIAKKIVGPVHRRQIPLAAMISCIIILIADTFSRNIFSPIEIPAGITIAIVGVPYFVYLMMRE